jgi:hypothetical protein
MVWVPILMVWSVTEDSSLGSGAGLASLVFVFIFIFIFIRLFGFVRFLRGEWFGLTEN